MRYGQIIVYCLMTLMSGNLAADRISVWDQRINQLDEIHKVYCQANGSDTLCGGGSGDDLNGDGDGDTRIQLHQVALKLSQDIIFSRQYTAILENLNSQYSLANSERRATIEFLVMHLNGQWINRYQPELDYWFSTTQYKYAQNLGLGYALYVGIFSANSNPNIVKHAHRLLRLKLPWSALSLGLAGAGTLLADKSARRNRPLIPPPPFHFLDFGSPLEPEADLEAQISHAEYQNISETFANNAGVLAVLAAGPNWKALAARGSAARFMFLSRTLAATRVTPVSFIGGLIITELVKWTWSNYRARHLTEQIETFSPTGDHTGQEISLLINALHILFLMDAENRMNEMESHLASLVNSELDDQALAKEFGGWAIFQTHFASFVEQTHGVNAARFLGHRRDLYRLFVKKADKLIKRFDGIQAQDPLMRAAVRLRLESLQQKRDEAQKKFENFPKDLLLSRLMQLYARH